MRITRCRMFLLCGALLLFIGPAMVMGQPGGPPGGGGGRGGRGGGRGGRGGFDPNMIFNLLSGGKDYIVVAEMLANPMVAARDPGAKERVESFMQRHGITNGQLTREQFAEYMQERMTERRAAHEAANPGGAAPGAPSDGAPGSDPLVEPPPPEEDKRPVVYRAGKLPKELPPWFAQMDEDKDGQVGLYEWKKAGRSISEFQAMDLNGDGFITVEEALRYAKMEGKNGQNVASNGPGGGFGGGPSFGGRPGSGAPSFGGPPSFGGQPGMGGPPSFGGPSGGGGPPSFGGPPGKGGPPDGQSGQGNNFRRRRRDQQQ